MKRPINFRFIIIWGIVIPLLLLWLWFSFASCANLYPEFGEKLPKADWSPDHATEISFYKSYSYTAYEYKISEDDFRRSRDISEYREITKPVSIHRYNCIFESQYFYRKPNRSWDESERFQKSIIVTVTNGIMAEYRQHNGGGYISAYDRDTGKAYYMSTPR